MKLNVCCYLVDTIEFYCPQLQYQINLQNLTHLQFE